MAFFFTWSNKDMGFGIRNGNNTFLKSYVWYLNQNMLLLCNLWQSVDN